MRNLKKVLALVVAFSMMLSVVAFASFNDVPEDADYAGAVELLSALDIIVGDDLGNFNPNNTITRAEMAAIVCRIKGLEASANAAKGNTIFTDVPAEHWASGYVNVANQNGIIAGYGDGLFGPEDQVTYEAAVKMVVSALGFEPMAAQKGGWPTGYLVVANTYKISEGVAGSTRADVAVLVSNAMSTPVMDQSVYGADAEFEVLDGKKGRDYRTLLTDMDIYIATGVVYDVEVDDVDFLVTEDSDDLEFEVKGDDPAEDCITLQANGSNIADYQFQSVDVYVKKTARKDYNVVAVVGSAIGETFKLLSDDIKNIDGGVVEYYVDPANSSKTKELKTNITTVVYNKALQAGNGALNLNSFKNAVDVELVFIENTGDKYYDVLVATEYTSEVLEFVDVEKEKIALGGDTVAFDYEDEAKTYVLVDEAGKELTLADFAEDDVIAWYANASSLDNADFIKVIKLTDAAVEGVVEEAYTSNGDEYVVVDGQELKVADDVELSVGDEGIFYVGMTGKVILFDGSATGVNYAYVLEAALSTKSFSDNKWQVKLLTKDGVAIYDMTDDASDDFATDFDSLMDDDDDDEDETTAEILWAEGDLSATRLVTYKTNAKGEIKALESVASIDNIAADKKYNADTQIIDGNAIEDDTIIFMINEDKADNTSASDISFLVDEGIYGGAVYEDEDDEIAVMIITVGDAAFSAETGLAIVTKVSDTKDADDNDVVKVSYVQGEEDGVVTFDDDSTSKSACDVDDLSVGDVFIFNATADGVVTNYAVIAEIVDVIDDNGTDTETDDEIIGQTLALCEDINDTKIASLFGEDTTLEVTYIANTKRETNTKGEKITLADGETILVKSGAYKYTYNDEGRNTVIETGSFRGGNAWYYDADNDEYTPVLVRITDNVVIDIYSVNDRFIAE